ncbi:hypothetical protein KCP73_01035 [Salmonella enterica subsp. enterica]|nr:hypothetical protein KCP73_01035 [Salmonella enterica subsp. enterica]
MTFSLMRTAKRLQLTGSYPPQCATLMSYRELVAGGPLDNEKVLRVVGMAATMGAERSRSWMTPSPPYARW